MNLNNTNSEEKDLYKRIKFVIESNFEYVELVGLSINKICSFYDIDEINSYEIESCVVEAVNNCIEHSYEHNTDKEVEIILNLFKDELVVEIIDSGLFNNNFQPVQQDFSVEDIDNLPEGGFGLQLIFDIMDKVEYQNINNKNVLTMSKILNK